MSRIIKLINSEQVSFSGQVFSSQVFSRQVFSGQVLADNELDSVSGGSSALQDAFSNVIKNIGDALSAAARKA